MIKDICIKRQSGKNTLQVYNAATKNNSSGEMSFPDEPQISKDQTAYIESI